jgi:hypothetical protein
VPEDGGDEEAEFANQMFRLPPYRGGMSVSLSRFMRQTMLAFIEGFSVFEEVRHIPDRGPLNGKIVIRKMAHRAANTVWFLMDDHGGFNGIRQRAYLGGRLVDVLIPKEKVWYYACNEEENPFYGVSYFEAAWHHWEIKRRLYYIAHIAAQQAAVPARIGKFPKTADQASIRAFQKMLADFSFNTSGTMPSDFDVQFAQMSSGFDFIRLIEHQNQQMAKSVLAKFLEDSNRQVLIESGRGDASADFFTMALEGVMSEIAESLSHYLIPKYIDWNFKSERYPRFVFGQLVDSVRDTLKDLFMAVATAQSSMWTPEFIREVERKLVDRLGLNVDYEAVAKREEEEKAQQQALQAQYFQQQGGGAAPFSAIDGGGVALSGLVDRVERLLLERSEGDADG